MDAIRSREGSAIRVDMLHNLVTISRGGKIGNPRLRLLTFSPQLCIREAGRRNTWQPGVRAGAAKVRFRTVFEFGHTANQGRFRLVRGLPLENRGGSHS